MSTCYRNIFLKYIHKPLKCILRPWNISTYPWNISTKPWNISTEPWNDFTDVWNMSKGASDISTELCSTLTCWLTTPHIGGFLSIAERESARQIFTGSAFSDIHTLELSPVLWSSCTVLSLSLCELGRRLGHLWWCGLQQKRPFPYRSPSEGGVDWPSSDSVAWPRGVAITHSCWWQSVIY